MDTVTDILTVSLNICVKTSATTATTTTTSATTWNIICAALINRGWTGIDISRHLAVEPSITHIVATRPKQWNKFLCATTAATTRRRTITAATTGWCIPILTRGTSARLTTNRITRTIRNAEVLPIALIAGIGLPRKTRSRNLTTLRLNWRNVTKIFIIGSAKNRRCFAAVCKLPSVVYPISRTAVNTRRAVPILTRWTSRLCTIHTSRTIPVLTRWTGLLLLSRLANLIIVISFSISVRIIRASRSIIV